MAFAVVVTVVADLAVPVAVVADAYVSHTIVAIVSVAFVTATAVVVNQPVVEIHLFFPVAVHLHSPDL